MELDSIAQQMQYTKSVKALENDKRRGHELLPLELREKLPKLYATEELGNKAKALVKFFSQSSNWTWYASEFDGQDTFYGLVSGFVVEYGYFSLSELEEACDPVGWPIERDLGFKPTQLGKLYRQHRDR